MKTNSHNNREVEPAELRTSEHVVLNFKLRNERYQIMKQKNETLNTDATKVVEAMTAAFPSEATNIEVSVDALASLRLSQSFGKALGTKKQIMTIPVRKPIKTDYFMVHPSPNMRLDTLALVVKQDNEIYLVKENVIHPIFELLQAVTLYTAIDRRNNLFIIKVPLPEENGRTNSWSRSMSDVVKTAETNWVRSVPNMQISGYDMYVAGGDLPKPIWPEITLPEIIHIAFKDKIIDDINHPIIRQIQGEI